MSEIPRLSPHELISQFLNGTLSEEGAELLYSEVERNPEISRLLCENNRIDILLDGLSRQKREGTVTIIKEPVLSSQNSETTLVFETNAAANELPELPVENTFAVLEELIRLEREAKPVRSNSVLPGLEPKQTSRASEWFYGYWNKWFGKKEKSEKLALPAKKRSAIPFIIRLSLFVCFLAWMIWDGTHQKHIVLETNYANSIAKIMELVDVVWAPGTNQWQRGQELGPNKIGIDSGLLKIKFINGAELIMKGSSELVINSEYDTFLNRGHISAHIPKTAVGFSITTAFGRYVDRGTDFSLIVDENSARLDVVKGKVDFFEVEETVPHTTTTGKAVLVDRDHQVTTDTTDTDHYIDDAKFQTQLLKYSERKQEERDKIVLNMDTHQSLVTRFDFGHQVEGTFPNASKRGESPCPALKVNNINLCDGLIPGSKAILFNSPGSYGEVKLPGHCSSLTLSAMVRIDRLNNAGNILITSKNFIDEEGAILWQITRDGRLQFQITQDKTRKNKFETKPIMVRLHWGTWCVLTLVADAKNRSISQFVNGRCVKREVWPVPCLLKPRSITVGNLKNKKYGNNDRFLGGAIEWFAIYDTALPSDEVARVMVVPK